MNKLKDLISRLLNQIQEDGLKNYYGIRIVGMTSMC